MTTFFQHWHFMRLLRAGLAVWAAMEAYRTGFWLLLLPAAMFGLQAALNVGCGGPSGCALPPRKSDER
ncbi:MAG TPA: hypothetical protein PK971_08875 [Saprospiraceae bacterium]|nr:hypothetical protein [Saprospiraceae bacterium]HND88429.1 hypothetical protein [Saprospiraceae bacterium]